MATKPTKATKTTKPLKMAEPTATAPIAKAAPTPPAAARGTKSQAKAAPVPSAAAPVSTPTSPRVTFRAVRPGARVVAVAGTFNNWSPSSTPLIAGGDGQWSVDLALAPGVYEYRLVVDGEWVADPLASESMPNPFGGCNSVIRVG